MTSSQQTKPVEQVIGLHQMTPIRQVIRSHQTTLDGQMEPGQQVILVEVVRQKNKAFANYSSAVVYGLGVAQIAIGVFSVALGVSSVQIGSIMSFTGHGIWSGVLVSVPFPLSLLSESALDELKFCIWIRCTQGLGQKAIGCLQFRGFRCQFKKVKCFRTEIFSNNLLGSGVKYP